MLDFCAEHGIVADIELIRADQINEARERMVKGRREISLRDRQFDSRRLNAAAESPPPLRRANAKNAL